MKSALVMLLTGVCVALGAATPPFSPPPPPSGPPAPAPANPAGVPAPSKQAPAPPSSPASIPPVASPSRPLEAPPQGARPSIAILPFDAALPQYTFGTGPAAKDGDCGAVQRNAAEITKRCTQDLIETMVGTQRFRVVDRDTIDRVLREQDFHRSQGMDPAELARLGKLLGADRLVVTSLDLAGTQCRRVEVRASGYLTFEFSGGIEVAYRVVKVATSEIETTGRLTRTWDSKPNPDLKGVLSSPEGAIAFFSRQVAMAETFAILDAIDPIKVAAISDDQVVLNQGRGRPMFVGTTLRVMMKGEPIRDPDTGAILSEDAGEAALVQVTTVEEKVSRARVLVGDVTKITVGSRCKTVEVPPIP